LVPGDRDHDHVALCTNITAVARAQRLSLPASPQVVRRHRHAVGMTEHQSIGLSLPRPRCKRNSSLLPAACAQNSSYVGR